MKNILLIFLICLSSSLYSQYGQEGAILAASEGLIRAVEMDKLNKAAGYQAEIVNYSLAIAAATTQIVITEQKLYESETKLAGWIENLSMTAELVDSAIKLGTTLENTYSLASENIPDVVPYITTVTIDFTLEATAIVDDYRVAIKESQINLLSNQERIEVILVSQEALDNLNYNANKLYDFIYALTTIKEYENTPTPLLTYDANNPVLSAQELLDNLLIED